MVQVVLGADEVGKDMTVAPAGVAQSLPEVEVVPVAAHVHHPVEGGLATQHPAARELTYLAKMRGGLERNRLGRGYTSGEDVVSLRGKAPGGSYTHGEDAGRL